ARNRAPDVRRFSHADAISREDRRTPRPGRAQKLLAHGEPFARRRRPRLTETAERPVGVLFGKVAATCSPKGPGTACRWRVPTKANNASGTSERYRANQITEEHHESTNCTCSDDHLAAGFGSRLPCG